MVQNPSHDANWTVCDAVSEPAQGGHAAHSTGVTVIAGRPDSSGARAARSRPQQAILVDRDGSTWLLWDGKRSARSTWPTTRSPTHLAWGRQLRAARAPAHRAGPVQRDTGGTAADGAAASRTPVARRPFSVPAPIGAVVVSYAVDQSSSGAVALLRGAAGRPAADLAGARRDPAQHQFLWAGPTAAAGRRRRWPSCRCRGCWTPRGIRTNRSASSTRPNPRHVRLLEQAGRGRHQLAEPAVRLGAAGRRMRCAPSTWSAAAPRERHPRRPGARHRLLRPDRRRRRRPRRPPVRCSGSLTPAFATASTTRPSTRPPGTAKPLRHLALADPPSPSRGRCCRCSPMVRRYRAPTRCWHMTA